MKIIMNELKKQEIEKFKKTLKQYLGETTTVDHLLQRIMENQFNLALVDCNGKIYYLHEPAASDCMNIKK